MNVFGSSREERRFRRIWFYLVVIALLWLMGELSPAISTGAPSDQVLGVAPVYIASPEFPVPLPVPSSDSPIP